jgi:hypothetical protein
MTTTAPTASPEPQAFSRTASGILIIALLTALAAATAGQVQAATLEPVNLESREGYFQLHWEADEPIRLVEAPGADFTTPTAIYTGSDTGHVASGKPDGTWYYRLESADVSQVLSNTATITVRHHSLQRALTFFTIGAAVFLATLGLIVFARPDSDERS